MTPHIEAKLGDIADTVIMPGDPKRAQMIADNYLENAQLVTSVRGILGFTGTYKGKRVTVMASGMGCPSMGIYSYELYSVYHVEKIIRIGSFGAYTKNLNLYDVVLVDSSYSNSNYAYIQDGTNDDTLYPSKKLNEKIMDTAKRINMEIRTGKIYCSDVFYSERISYKEMYEVKGCLGVEMESFALFQNAKHLNKEAACLLTVSDNLETKEETSSLERQNAFTKMIVLALESVL